MGRARWTVFRTWLTACLIIVAGAASAQPAASAQSPSNTVSPDDLVSTAAFVDAYYTALNARDLDAVIRMWSREMPSRGPMAETLDRMFKGVYPSWTEVRVATTSVDGHRARLVIQFTMSYQPPPGASVGGASRPFARRTLFVLAREQREWRLFEEKTVEQDLAERLIALNDDAAAVRLAESEFAPGAGAVVGVDATAGAVTGSKIALVRALFASGGHAASRQRYDEALRVFETAAKIVDWARSQPEPEFARTFESLRAQTLSQQAFVYTYRPRGDFARALALLEQALSIYEANGDKNGIGEALLGMATAAYSSPDYARALTLYERAMAVHTELQDTPAIVREQIGIGNVRYLFAQLDEARRMYREALAQAETLGITGDMTRALQGLGRVYVAMGDYTRGRDQYLAALKLAEASGATGEQASTLLEIGRTEFLRGDLGAARERYGRALGIEQQSGHAFGVGRAHYALALIDVLSADYDAAIKTYTASIEAYKSATSAEGVGEALLGRAAAWLEQENLKPAIADFTEGLAVFERLTHVEGMARANLGLAIAQVAGKNAAAAVACADRAAALADRAVMPDIRWQARYQAGRAWLLSGDAAKARAAFEEAIETIESGRLDAATDPRTPAGRAAPYAALVEWHIAHGDAPRALLLAEDEKRRVLEDLLQPFRPRLARGLTADRVAEEQRLIGQRVSLLAQMRREVERGAAGEARMAALQQTLQAARAASAEWESAAVREAPRTSYLRGEARLSSPDALDTLAAALPADAALIQFVSNDEHLSVIVATPRTARAAATPASASAADAQSTSAPAAATSAPAADTAATATSTPSPLSPPPAALDVRAYSIDITRRALAERVEQFGDGASAESLFDLLLGPAREQLDGRAQLVIVPDDVLWMLPFEALQPSPNHYLVEHVAITYLPSIATWLANPAWLANPSAATAVASAAAEPATAEPTAAAPAAGTPAAGTPAATAPAAATSAVAAPATAMLETTTPAAIRWADAEVSDVSPLQSTLTLAADDSVAVAVAAQPLPAAQDEPAAAWGAQAAPLPHAASDWLWRVVSGDLAIVANAKRSPMRLRLDIGRLGGVALAWSLSATGLPRTVIARRELDSDARAVATRVLTDALAQAAPHDDVAQAVRAATLALRAALDASRADASASTGGNASTSTSGTAEAAVPANANANPAAPALSNPRDWAIWQLIGPPSPVRGATPVP